MAGKGLKAVLIAVPVVALLGGGAYYYVAQSNSLHNREIAIQRAKTKLASEKLASVKSEEQEEKKASSKADESSVASSESSSAASQVASSTAPTFVEGQMTAQQMAAAIIFYAQSKGLPGQWQAFTATNDPIIVNSSSFGEALIIDGSNGVATTLMPSGYYQEAGDTVTFKAMPEQMGGEPENSGSAVISSVVTVANQNEAAVNNLVSRITVK